MGDEQEPGGGSSGIWISVAAAIPLLYFLSVGPAIMVYDRSSSSVQDTIETIYAPVEWAAENTPLAGPIEWYASLWR